MSKGGGQTQSSTSKVEIPKWLEDAAQANIARAKMVADTGYVPNYGLDVAAFSPLQQQGMQATGMGAQAFGFAPQGFDATAGIPTPETSGGFTGYRSGNMFDEALAQLAQRRPAQYLQVANQFVDPISGAASAPTALETIYDPNSTDAQINALYGTADTSGDSWNPEPKTALERYIRARDFNYGDKGLDPFMRNTMLGGVAQALNQSFIDKYEKDNFWRTGNMYEGNVFKTSNMDEYNKMLERGVQAEYVPPPPPAYTGGYDGGFSTGNTNYSRVSDGSGGWTTTNNNTGYSASFSPTASFGSGSFNTSGTFGD